MKIALQISLKGRRSVYPNPMVGCVIVKNNTIVAKGWHERFGGHHAEIEALNKAGNKARGADLYVTLEPCAHWGKTPPCADAIVKAGIARVIYGMPDPNPATSCQCHNAFKQSGIAYIGGILKRDIEFVNKDYCDIFKKSRKMHVIAKSAMSLDGKIALASGDSRWITSEKARNYVHVMRAGVDGIMVGVNTVIMDNPNLTSHGKGRNPVRIIIDPRLRSPVNSNVFNSAAGTILFHSTDKLKAKLSALKNKGVVVVKMNKQIDLKNMFSILSKMHIYNILIEGGGKTIGRAFDAGLVNEVAFFIAPKIVGGCNSITPVEGKGVAHIADAVTLGSVSIKRLGNDMLISAAVVK